MNKTEVLALLKENKNERGIENWKKLGSKDAKKLKSFGIGLTQLRKLAKQVGKDHDLAMKLWASDVYDAKVIGLLIDDPKVITRDQAETQVEQLGHGMLAHVFASCDATLAKAPFSVEVASEWVSSKDDVRRTCGYLLIYELSKSKKKNAPDEAFFLGHVATIAKSLQKESNWVRDAMNTALFGMGKRSKALNTAALKAAKSIGKVHVDYGDNGCEVLDVVKHLTSPALKKKLGVS